MCRSLGGGQCSCATYYPISRRWTIYILILLPNVHAYTQDNFNVPCNYLDSINITDGRRNMDGSITFRGVRFANGDYGTFDYTFENGIKRVSTEPHIRGCPCKHRSCVSLCCPPGYIYMDVHGCTWKPTFDMPIEVWNQANETKIIDLFKDFGYVLNHENLPCVELVEKTPEEVPTDVWYLYDVSLST